MDIQQLSSEKTKLAELGITSEALSRYQVVCLPENVFRSEKVEDLYEAADASNLAKLLKASDVQCATALDLGLDVPILERRSNDTWLGVLWVLATDITLPIVVNVISNLIISKLNKKPEARVKPAVHLDLYIERGRNVVKLAYKGDGGTLAKILKSIEPEQKAP